ncbi:B-cell receptor CD22-like [Xyrauchen texanus]|uniref:B-cell receptor CD22-like n=1 Tax=Xyrauchen texanus TaxID=154827 RepID=UPI00224252F5|nr:B-cell receptor CD22-like [Xyrauchen texanus]
MAPPLPLMFLLVIPRVYSADDWGVSYSSKYICALKGSSVIMSCTYKYPHRYKIKKVFWTKSIEKGVEPQDLFNDPEYSQRIQYLGDKQQNCTIRLNDVTQKDSHKYYFRFTTNKPAGKWIGDPGVTLNITDLHVESPESVTEGDTVSLTCKSTCNLTDRTTFIWRKNTQSLTERNNKLLLQSVRREDAGRYSCAVHGHNLTSPHVYLNVKYPPENPVISINPSGEIVLGDSVTLTCSSDSNPPVLNYTWFKENTTVGSGEIYSITSIRSDHSGEYKCKSINEVGEKYSDTVTLNVMYSPRNVSVSMSGSGEIVLGDSVTLTCSSDSNPPVLNYTWFKVNESSSVGSGQSYSALQSGFFFCVAQNQHGSQRSAAVSVTVHHRSGWHVVLGIMMGCGGLFFIIIIIIIILFKMKKRAGVKNENLSRNQYDSIKPKRLRGNLTAGKAPEYTAEIEYATVQHHKHKEKKRTEEHETQNDRSFQSDWDVSYSSSYICALKGSSVIMSCTYKYPPGYKIKKVFWTKTDVKVNDEHPDLFNDTEYSQRIQYLGDKQQNCTIRLNDVTQKDSHEYYFRFITNKPDGRWTGYPGVTLDITDLHVESPESVTEGDTVSLTCKSTCNLTDRTTFIWWKNTQSLTERNNKLLLQSVRREDAGRYSCAVHGHNLTSPHVYLNVKYSPKTVSVSMSGSGEIFLGDSVNLTCSSDSNPPVLNYTWFKENTTVGSGEIYSITSIRSDHSGEYKCKSRNEVGEKYSDTVTLNVMYSPRNVSVSMSGSGEIVLGDSVNLTCSSDSNPPVLNYTWFKENESSSVGSGQSYSALQSGFFYCVTQNQHGSQRSAAVSVTVHYRSGWHVVWRITLGCGGFIIIIIIITILLKKKKRAGVKNENLSGNQDQIYCDVIERVSVHDAPLSESETSDQNDAQYASIKPKRLRGNLTAGKAPEYTAEIEYATVQHHKHKEKKRTEEHETQNDRRSDMQTVEEDSVIYSSVK